MHHDETRDDSNQCTMSNYLLFIMVTKTQPYRSDSFMGPTHNMAAANPLATLTERQSHRVDALQVS